MALLKPNPNRKYEELKDAAVKARQAYEREAWLNLAFYLDEQYVEWHDASDSLRRIPRDPRSPGTPRPVVNKIMHFVQQEVSYALQDEPTADVLPPTDDIGDIMDVGVAKAYTDYITDPVMADFERQLARAALWAAICGDGYLKWIWNPSLKRPDIIPVSWFELYPDPYAKDFGRARYIVHSQFMDLEQVYEAWGKELPENRAEQADPMRTELLRGMGASPVLTGVTVNELWHKPCRRYPQGLYTVWAGREQLVAPQPLPYEHQRLPFTQIGAIERPDSLHYMSPVKYLRSAQMILNKYHAQRIMNREGFANYKWWVPAELELEELPHDGPRQVLRGHGGGMGLKPEILAPPAMTDNGDGQVIEEQMMHIVGLHEVSQAQVPGRVEAAKAIEMLKDSDESRHITMRRSIRRSISEGFYQVLELARQYESDEVMVNVYSREGVPEVKRFKASALKPGFRIRVTMGSGLGRTRAARNDTLMNLWLNKVITDPEVMADMMELPTPSTLSHKAVDVRTARNENLEMAKGVPITPNSWDDHVIHLRELNTYRKSHDYTVLPDDTKAMFEYHAQTHEQLLDAEYAKQANRMAIAQGAASPTGGPAEPPANGPAAENQPTGADAQGGQTATDDASGGTVSP